MMRKLIQIVFISFSYCELVSPTDGSNLNQIHILFEWDQVPEAIEYDIQISQDTEFATIEDEIRTSSLIHIEKQVIDWNKTYFWRVRPVFDVGPGNWTNSFTFNTGQKLSESTTNDLEECCYEDGVTIFGAFFNYFSAVIDRSGQEIWNSGNDNFVYYSLSDQGNMLGCQLITGTQNNLPGSERTFNGDIIWEEPNNEFLHHDLILLPNGNYLGIIETSSYGPIPVGDWTTSFQSLGFQADGVTVEFPWIGDKLVEWDRDSKEVVWSWNVFDHFEMSDYDELGGTWTEAFQNLHYDWTHVNAVIFDEEESSLYISVRHLSRITKISYPSGDIIWNMGHSMPSGDANIGNDIGFSFQHSIQKLENGNLVTFDNGNLSQEFRGTTDPISRALEININEDGASVIWSYDLPSDLFGFASGNTHKLKNGNYLLTTVGGGGRSIEINNEGDIVWEGLYNLSLPDGAVYRAHRIPGLFPIEFTVLVNDLMEHDGIEGVYLPEGNSSIGYEIKNEGDHPILLICQISDEQGWFEAQNIEISIGVDESQSISFIGEIGNIIGGNPIQLMVTPIDNPIKEKIIMVNAYTAPLSGLNQFYPSDFQFKAPYPNPFNPLTSIDFIITEKQNVNLSVFDLNGRKLETIINSIFPAGNHSIDWNAKNTAAGVYFLKMNINGISKTEKVLLLK